MVKKSVNIKAKKLLESCRYGVLSTQSVKMPGYPFGSVTPYSLDKGGNPVILISRLAQHTKNININTHVSLTVVEPECEDVQTSERLTVMADAELIERLGGEITVSHLNVFPDAQQFLELGDFDFYRLVINRGYYVGGFGQISWVDGNSLTR